LIGLPIFAGNRKVRTVPGDDAGQRHMTDRQFRILLGFLLVLALYLDYQQLLLAIVAYLFFEGLTNWRLPLLLSRANGSAADLPSEARPEGVSSRIPFDAERMLRLLVATFLVLSIYLYPQYIWWFSWFVGFALLGAGISGVCPMVLFLKLVGFR
jgi:hypothetical protein